MASKGTLTVRLIGDSKPLKRELDGAGSKVAGFAKAAVLAGGAAAAAFGVKAVQGAMELNETLSKTEQVFKGASGDVIGFADDMASAFGLPKQEILDAASNIGLVAKASGLSEEAAAGMSTEMAQLAADASSFFNVPLDQALEKIRAGLVGEAEPLRQFGVLLSAAAVQEKAVAAGIAEAGAELTEQQKVMARSMIIQEQMADASGDLERTQDSLANRFRALKGRATNFAAEVGMKLIPFVEMAFDAFERLSAVVGPILSSAFEQIGAFLSPFIERLSSVSSTVTAAQGPFLAWRDTVLDVFGQFRDFALVVFSKFQTWVRDNQTTIDAWRVKIDEIVAKIAPIFKAAFDAVSLVVSTVLSVLTEMWDRFGSHLVTFLGNTFGRILSVIGEAFDIIKGIFDLVIGILTGDWDRAWGAIKEIVASAFGIVQNIISQAWDTIKTVFGAGVAAISKFWGDLWDGIKSTARAAIQPIIDLVDSIIGRIQSMISTAQSAADRVGSIISKIPTPGSITRGIGGLIGRIPGFDSGGVVPGPVGSPQLILAHGGETVLPTHKNGGATGPVINIYGDTREIDADRLATLLRRAEILAGMA